jgi:hypothetical protein
MKNIFFKYLYRKIKHIKVLIIVKLIYVYPPQSHFQGKQQFSWVYPLQFGRHNASEVNQKMKQVNFDERSWY